MVAESGIERRMPAPADMRPTIVRDGGRPSGTAAAPAPARLPRAARERAALPGDLAPRRAPPPRGRVQRLPDACAPGLHTAARLRPHRRRRPGQGSLAQLPEPRPG